MVFLMDNVKTLNELLAVKMVIITDLSINWFIYLLSTSFKGSFDLLHNQMNSKKTEMHKN